MTQRKVVIITGAGGGIGLPTAVAFAQRGHGVALMTRNADHLKKAAKAVEDAGGEALQLPGDLADLDYAKRAIDDAAAHFGRIDALVNNAAWRQPDTMRTISVDTWEKTIRINLTAPAFLTQWVAPYMEKQGKGAVIHVSSVMSQIAGGIGPAYIACKGALDALTRDQAVTYGPRGVRVVSINPGAINTDMSGDYESADGVNITKTLRDFSEDYIPLRRWGEAEEIAKTIVWLAGDDASYITGTCVFADGGLRHNYLPYSIKQLMHPEDYGSDKP